MERIYQRGFLIRILEILSCFKRDGKFYILVGNKDNQTGAKQIIMFVSEDITGPYTYAGVVYKRTDLGGILECPDLITIDETDVFNCFPTIH